MSKYDFQLDMDSNNSLSLILSMIKKGKKVLEFGPAEGRMTRYLSEVMKCTVDIVEIDEEAGKTAAGYSRKSCLGIKQGDIENFRWLEILGDEQYDYIIFADVLEHLRNPLKVLNKAKQILKEDGYVLLSVPNIAHSAIIINLINNDFTYREVGLLDNTHIHFFTYQTLRDMIQESGYYPIRELATYARVSETEFNINYNSISLSSRKEIRNKKFGNVYQFVFQIAKRDSHGVMNQLRERNLDRYANYEFVCYYQTNEFNEYSEEKCKRFFYTPGKNRFILEFEEEQLHMLRIDPIDCNCIIRNFGVYDISSGDQKNKLELLSTNGLQGDCNQIIFDTDDPIICINVSEKNISKIEVRFDVVEYENELIKYIKEIQQQYYEDVRKLKKEYEEKIYELEIVKNDIMEQKEVLTKEYAEKNMKLEKSTRELSSTKEEVNKIKEELTKLMLEQSYHEDEIQKNRGEVRIRQEEVHKSQIELQKLQDELNRVYASSSWKITGIYRAIGRKIRNYKVKRLDGNTKRKISDQMETPALLKEQTDSTRGKINEKVCFSIIVPLYNTPLDYLNELVESCQKQVYSKWELCFGDGSDKEHRYVRESCEKFMTGDSRIKYTYISENQGIAVNTIGAFGLSKGDYIVLLDHDDILTPDALLEIATCIEKYKDADFIYSDRGIFNDKTKDILAYHYLPGFSPEFLRACNYASHLNAFSRTVINKVGFIREGYDGSQDYDFELRVIEKARRIVNIPKVLYYCRACEGSVAFDPESKMYAYEAGRRAIEEHIYRIGYPGKVEFLKDTFSYRIHYKITEEPVSIIIPNMDHVNDLQKCLKSIIDKTSYKNYEIVIVENNSKDRATFEYYNSLKTNINVRIINYAAKEFNFSAINNFAVGCVETKYLLFLNNDTEIINDNWLTEMIMFGQRADVGAVGAKLLYSDNTYQHVGLIIGLGGSIVSHYDYKKPSSFTGYMHRLTMPQNYNAVTAACMLVKRKDFLDVGGFDEENFKVALNDVDLCLKLRHLGRVNVWTPYAELYHYESISRGLDTDGEALERYNKECNYFKNKWASYYQNGDEYANDNFKW